MRSSKPYLCFETFKLTFLCNWEIQLDALFLNKIIYYMFFQENCKLVEFSQPQYGEVEMSRAY